MHPMRAWSRRRTPAAPQRGRRSGRRFSAACIRPGEHDLHLFQRRVLACERRFGDSDLTARAPRGTSGGLPRAVTA